MDSNETVEKRKVTLSISEGKRKRQKGVTTVEYAIMLVLIAIAVMIGNPDLSNSVSNVFSNMTTLLAG